MFLILRPIIKFGLTVLRRVFVNYCTVLINIMNVLFGENTENQIFVIVFEQGHLACQGKTCQISAFTLPSKLAKENLLV